MPLETLLKSGNPLADPANQLLALRSTMTQKSFQQALVENGLDPLRSTGIEVLQVNVGKQCNMTCNHCHVDAGPDRSERMTHETAQACIAALASTDIPTLDLTGGATEMNDSFRWMVEQSSRLGRHTIDRCNLTILDSPDQADLPEFLAEHRVEVVASLPCYLAENVNTQRGNHTFERSIDHLRHLNALGYGTHGSERTLTLVYNPIGPTLPPAQHALENTYRQELASRYGVVFSRLFTITNMPLGRFLHHLIQTEKYEAYLEKLIAAFNPLAARNVMCRTTVSVDWEGRLYDCDFNQSLDVTLGHRLPQNIRQFDPEPLAERLITTGQHCFGCTAGFGSGCQGSITL